jgi:hypothetical protein
MRRGGAEGYAMLAALVVMVLAATFALVVVGAVHSMQVVEGGDASGWRAAALESRALAAVSPARRWRPGTVAGSAEGADGSAGWRVDWLPEPSAGRWPRELAKIRTAVGRAHGSDGVMLELRAEPWATGVTCVGDAQVDAPLSVSGSGVYVGGCLRGRENVACAAAPSALAGAPALDAARGDVYPLAAVHGGAGIFAQGVEIHDPPTLAFPDDTDLDAGLPVPPSWLGAPSAEFLLAAASEAMPPGEALSGGRLRLDELPPAVGDATIGGRCLLLPELDEVAVEGTVAPDAGRLLIVVRGDAVLGAPGEQTSLSGGLVVCGHLEVLGPVSLRGALHAGSLSVGAPLAVSLDPGWRASPLSGASLPTLVECGG